MHQCPILTLQTLPIPPQCFFLLPSCKSHYHSCPSLLFGPFSLLSSIGSSTLCQHPSIAAARVARDVPQSGVQWLLMIGGTWQSPETGRQPYFFRRSPEFHRSWSQDSIVSQYRIINHKPYTAYMQLAGPSMVLNPYHHPEGRNVAKDYTHSWQVFL